MSDLNPTLDDSVFGLEETEGQTEPVYFDPSNPPQQPPQAPQNQNQWANPSSEIGSFEACGFTYSGPSSPNIVYEEIPPNTNFDGGNQQGEPHQRGAIVNQPMMGYTDDEYTSLDQPPPGNFNGPSPVNAGGSSWNYNQNSNQFQNQEMGMPTDEHGNLIVPPRGSWDESQSSSQSVNQNYPQSFTQQLSEPYDQGNNQFSPQNISQPCGSSGQMSYQSSQFYNQTNQSNFNQMPVVTSSANQGAPIQVDENWSGVTKSDQLPEHHLLVERPSSRNQAPGHDSNKNFNITAPSPSFTIRRKSEKTPVSEAPGKTTFEGTKAQQGYLNHPNSTTRERFGFGSRRITSDDNDGFAKLAAAQKISSADQRKARTQSRQNAFNQESRDNFMDEIRGQLNTIQLKEKENRENEALLKAKEEAHAKKVEEMRLNIQRMKEEEEREQKRKQQERLDAQRAAQQITPNEGQMVVLEPQSVTPVPIEQPVPVLDSDADVIVLEEIPQSNPTPYDYQHELIPVQQPTDPRQDFPNDPYHPGAPSSGMVEYFPTGTTSGAITALEDRPGPSTQEYVETPVPEDPAPSQEKALPEADKLMVTPILTHITNWQAKCAEAAKGANKQTQSRQMVTTQKESGFYNYFGRSLDFITKQTQCPRITDRMLKARDKVKGVEEPNPEEHKEIKENMKTLAQMCKAMPEVAGYLHQELLKLTLEKYRTMDQNERGCWEEKINTKKNDGPAQPKPRAPRKIAKARKSANRPRNHAAKSPAVPTEKPEEQQTSESQAAAAESDSEGEGMRTFRCAEPSYSHDN